MLRLELPAHLLRPQSLQKLKSAFAIRSVPYVRRNGLVRSSEEITNMLNQRRFTGSFVATLVLLIGLATGVSIASSSQAFAASPTYHVVTDVGHRVSPTTAPDGSYGIPSGAAFLVECQILGQPFPNGNALYFRTTYGTETPTYVPDYYSDSPHLGTQPPITGIPMCGATSTPVPTTAGGASVFYSGLGDAGWTSAQPYASVTLTDNGTHSTNDWSAGNCSTASAANFPATVGGRTVTTATGWSLGRLGPIYLLKQSSSYAANIHYVLMFDPGSYGEMSGANCDTKVGASDVLATWLASSPTNRLVIMAGAATADYKHPVNGYAHAGIQNVYFPKIRGRAIANQVLVCNVETNGVPWSHSDTYTNYASMINQPPPSTCPSNFLGWHP
jgi:hypothetical protein